MKVFKIVLFVLLTLPLIIIGVSTWVINIVCYCAAEAFENAERITGKAQRTCIFDGWIAWARKVSKLD
ncbi:hypothetical protein QO517_004356 [Salmonella enterica]|nr:hypothetical protein [Salmonella enterica]ELP1955752.1 hypothetical protein [Salmonella enterica]ELX4917761.1 hypothetical protein [Salmonella enterica]